METVAEALHSSSTILVKVSGFKEKHVANLTPHIFLPKRLLSLPVWYWKYCGTRDLQKMSPAPNPQHNFCRYHFFNFLLSPSPAVVNDGCIPWVHQCTQGPRRECSGESGLWRSAWKEERERNGQSLLFLHLSWRLHSCCRSSQLQVHSPYLKACCRRTIYQVGICSAACAIET